MRLLRTGGVEPLYSGAQTIMASLERMCSITPTMEVSSVNSFSAAGVYIGMLSAHKSVTTPSCPFSSKDCLNFSARSRFFPVEAAMMRIRATKTA
mgnify:CR=1 FL=1|jgi:hypothetical protein